MNGKACSKTQVSCVVATCEKCKSYGIKKEKEHTSDVHLVH